MLSETVRCSWCRLINVVQLVLTVGGGCVQSWERIQGPLGFVYVDARQTAAGGMAARAGRFVGNAAAMGSGAVRGTECRWCTGGTSHGSPEANE
jgi:hypothetical protein